MSKHYLPGLTIVDTASELPSASDFQGLALVKDTNSIRSSGGSSWSSPRVTSESLGMSPNTDVTVALNAAIAAAGAGLEITFAKGTYIISDTININQNSITIKGSGRANTVFQFSPSTDKVMFNYNKGASIQFYCGISDCSIYSVNTTNTKTALYISDNSQFHISNVNISGFTGKDSIGIRLLGRENNTFERIFVGADICVKLSPNTNTLEWLSVDHCVFRDTYLLANSLPTSGGTVPTTCVLIDDKANISGLTFEGRNAWVSGQRGLYNLDTTSTMVSYMVKLGNIRREQPSGTTTFPAIYISRPASGRLQGLLIENFYNGANFPNTTQTGVYFRGIDQIEFNNTIFSDNTNTNTVLDIDNCTAMEWINAKFLVTSAATMLLPNMEITSGGQRLAGNLYPLTCSWEKKPAAIYQQVPKIGMNGAKTWEYSGTLTNNSTLQIPINTDNGYKLATIDLVGVSTDGTEFEGGSFAIGLTDDTGITGSVTASTASTTVSITGGTFPLTIAGKKLYNIETFLGTIASVAGDGLSLILTANSLANVTNVTTCRHTSKDSIYSVRGCMRLSGSAKVSHTNTAGNLMVWCNSATTAMKNNVYIYNRIGKDMYVVVKATFY
jgi:hypothetical protein